MELFTAQVTFKNPENQSFNEMIGIFSTTNNANVALTDFIEGVLLQEYPESHSIERDIVEYQLDEALM
jgi:hypothetical protein